MVKPRYDEAMQVGYGARYSALNNFVLMNLFSHALRYALLYRMYIRIVSVYLLCTTYYHFDEVLEASSLNCLPLQDVPV